MLTNEQFCRYLKEIIGWHLTGEREKKNKVDTNKSYILYSDFIVSSSLPIQMRVELRNVLRRHRELKLHSLIHLFELTELSKRHGAIRTIT